MEQQRLFDDKPYIDHHFYFPNVVEIHPVPIEDTGHDDFGEMADIIEFPDRFPPEDIVA